MSCHSQNGHTRSDGANFGVTKLNCLRLFVNEPTVRSRAGLFGRSGSNCGVWRLRKMFSENLWEFSSGCRLRAKDAPVVGKTQTRCKLFKLEALDITSLPDAQRVLCSYFLRSKWTLTRMNIIIMVGNVLLLGNSVARPRLFERKDMLCLLVALASGFNTTLPRARVSSTSSCPCRAI